MEHRRVGVLQQGCRVSPILRKNSHADRTGHMLVGTIDDKGRAQRIKHLLRDASATPLALKLVEQHNEFVSALPRNGIARAYRLAETSRHLAKQLIAGVVTQGVVDVLEVIDINKHDGKLVARSLSSDDGLRNPVLHQRAVWQAGQRVMKRQMLNVLLNHQTFTDIARIDNDPLDRGNVQTIGRN